MRKSDTVNITCAVTGSIHTPTISPHLPTTPAEIVEASVAAAEAGVAIICLHARDPGSGKRTPEQVRGIRLIPGQLSFEITTPTEARSMLARRGGDQAAF